MFAGLLYCADCGRKLHFNVNHPHSELQYFNCSNYRGNRGTCNQTHYIRVDALNQVMLLEIRRLTAFLQDKEEDFVKLLMAKTLEVAERESARREEELRANLADVPNWTGFSPRPTRTTPAESCPTSGL